MAEVNDMYWSIYQNLLDAGCDQQTADKCMVLIKEKRFTDMMQIFTRYRKSLLDSLHTSQKQIDCLDYLLYKIKKYSNVKENEKWKIRIPEHLKLTLRLR